MTKRRDENPQDPELAALAAWLESYRKERKRSDVRYEAARQSFEIAHRRLRELARSA